MTEPIGYLIYRNRRRILVRPFRRLAPHTTATWPFIVAYQTFAPHGRVHYATCVCPSLREARAPFRAWGWTKRTVVNVEVWLPKGLRLNLRNGKRLT
jgi:hypothetical protein